MTIPYHGPQDLLGMAGSTDHRHPATAGASGSRFTARYATTQPAEADGAPSREWPVRLGASIARRYAELLAEVRAAQVPLPPETAARVGREQAGRARGDGISWEQIGEALGLDQGPDGMWGYDLGIAAFEYFTGEPGLGYPASFQFWCVSCGGYITDHGPFDGHPQDNEQGHAEGCVRLAADIAAWQAQQGAWAAQQDAWAAQQGARAAQQGARAAQRGARQAEDRPVAPATYSVFGGTGTSYTAHRDDGGGRASWPSGRRGQPWLGGHGHHARRGRRRPRSRLVR